MRSWSGEPPLLVAAAVVPELHLGSVRGGSAVSIQTRTGRVEWGQPIVAPVRRRKTPLLVAVATIFVHQFLFYWFVFRSLQILAITIRAKGRGLAFSAKGLFG